MCRALREAQNRPFLPLIAPLGHWESPGVLFGPLEAVNRIVVDRWDGSTAPSTPPVDPERVFWRRRTWIDDLADRISERFATMMDRLKELETYAERYQDPGRGDQAE